MSEIAKGLVSPVLSIFKAITPKVPTAGDVKAPAVMPTADDATVQAAKRRQIAEIQSRSGRASTILSEGTRLGG